MSDSCTANALHGDSAGNYVDLRCAKRPHRLGDHVAILPDGAIVWWPRQQAGGTARARTPPEAVPLGQRARETAPVGSGSPSPFTGDQCQDCGSMNVVRTGTCGTCQNCGASTGCG